MSENKLVFITGGARGIGAATVRKFAAEGWKVAFTYLNGAEGGSELVRADVEKLAEETGAMALRADARSPEETASALGHACVYFGVPAPAALIANAGIAGGGPGMPAQETGIAGGGPGTLAPESGIAGGGPGGPAQETSRAARLLAEQPEEEIRRIIETNLMGSIWASRVALPRMAACGRGSLVLLSSIWGTRGASCESAYAASKAGIIGLGRSLAAEYGPAGIRVNIVAPGVIDTEMNNNITADDKKNLADETPLMRLGVPEEVADAIYFLCSDAASFITGQVLGVDGGFRI